MTRPTLSPKSGPPAQLLAVAALALAAGLAFGCSDDDEPSGPTDTGRSCTSADQCYPNVADDALLGDPVCMDRVEGGYCTHHCSQDSDCCAVPGECATSHPQVCGPFESTGRKYCFLSCEDEDLDDAGLADADEYCSRFAHAGFHCRSTGGGSENRRVCVP